MKRTRCLTVLLSLLIALPGYTQTNTFPATGNIGIGTLQPQAKLHLVHGGQEILLGTGNNTSGYALQIGINDDGINFHGTSYVRGFNISNPNGRILTILPSGNIGIGTTDTKGYKFAVNGSAVFTDVVVKAYNTWPDYVFEKQYPLMSLKALEDFIRTNKHLPEVPTAAEIAASGQDLGKINVILLRKIEELTLYMITQHKQQEALQHRISLQEQQIKALLEKTPR